MAAGTYKNGVAIIVTYQAVGLATGKTITMSVYDEAHALDEGQSGAMAEIGSTGRYWKSFTPDAEGEWIIVMTNTTDGGGDVVKAFAVAGHDVDSIGDAVAAVEGKVDTVDTVVDAIKAVTDVESGVKADVATVDGKVDAVDTVVDAIKAVTDVESGVKAVADAVQAKTDLIGASVAPAGEYDTELDQNLSTTESNIRGGDSDTLKTLSDQIDAVSAPAMVG